MNLNSKIAAIGSDGMVGSAIVRLLIKKLYTNVLKVNRSICDLTNQAAVATWFAENKPEYVILSAAKVGGIASNIASPADFGYINGMIELNVINECYKNNVTKLLFLGSSCIFPRNSQQPMKEEQLLTGPFEVTNEMYGLAKVFGIKLCEAYRKQYGCNFITLQPCNIFGEGDDFSPTGHVVGSLISKFHTAILGKHPTVTVWGDGTACREFLYVDDVADACLFAMLNYNEDKMVNVGMGIDYSIRDLAFLIKKITGFSGVIVFDETKPSGMPRKLLDCSFVHNLGWKHKIGLEEGIKLSYNWFKNK